MIFNEILVSYQIYLASVFPKPPSEHSLAIIIISRVLGPLGVINQASLSTLRGVHHNAHILREQLLVTAKSPVDSQRKYQGVSTQYYESGTLNFRSLRALHCCCNTRAWFVCELCMRE